MDSSIEDTMSYSASCVKDQYDGNKNSVLDGKALETGTAFPDRFLFVTFLLKLFSRKVLLVTCFYLLMKSICVIQQ